MSHQHSHDHRIAVVHLTAPTCWWSWGYEPVFNRLKLVYGDQIETFVFYGAVYEDVEEYKKGYELDDAGMLAWAKEAKEIMGVPMHLNYQFDHMPKTVFPATLAVMAARRQGSEKGQRFYRALLRRAVVEAQDVTREDVTQGAVKEAELDEAKFKQDWADQASLKADYEAQGEKGPPVHVGFYNIAVTDWHGRTVYLDQQFDPSVLEGAIDYLAGGKLKKTNPSNILDYIKAHGPTPLVEIERVFDLPPEKAQTETERLEKKGELKRTALAEETFWNH